MMNNKNKRKNNKKKRKKKKKKKDRETDREREREKKKKDDPIVTEIIYKSIILKSSLSKFVVGQAGGTRKFAQPEIGSYLSCRERTSAAAKLRPLLALFKHVRSVQ